MDAVPKGRWEAAKSLGLSFAQQLRLIVLPQGEDRRCATVGFMVQVIKGGTALASIIGFVEITQTGGMIANATFQPSHLQLCRAVLLLRSTFRLVVEQTAGTAAGARAVTAVGRALPPRTCLL